VGSEKRIEDAAVQAAQKRLEERRRELNLDAPVHIATIIATLFGFSIRKFAEKQEKENDCRRQGSGYRPGREETNTG